VDAGLVDELRLIVVPIVLGGGKALSKNVKNRHSLKLLESKKLPGGKVYLRYSARR